MSTDARSTNTTMTSTSATSAPRYSDSGMKLFLDLNGENPTEEPGTPIVESAAWGRAMAASRKWDSAAALADYLASQFAYWADRAPSIKERLAIARTASTIWADALSEKVAPSEPAPGGFRTMVCAWEPCRREFPEGKGFGIMCSKQCFVDEAEAGTVALGDDDDATGAA